MTEYDYSPEAYQRAMATHNRVSNWVVSQTYSRPQYNNPFQLTRSEAAERAASPQYTSTPSDFPGSPGLYAMELERRRGRDRSVSMSAAGHNHHRRSASTNTPGYPPTSQRATAGYRPPPTRSQTYSLSQTLRPQSSSQSTSRTTSPHRSNSLSQSHSSSRTRSPAKPPSGTYYAPQPAYPYQPHSQPVVYTSPQTGRYPQQSGTAYYIKGGQVQPYLYGGNNKVVQVPPGQQAYVYPGGDVRIVPSKHATPNTLKKKTGQPFLKRLFTGWSTGSMNSRDRRRRMSY
ncbi:hypothetical protein GLOTRDRAFT_122953 [Gloeophyllum trabeum ATCC 11539]|uniref:Uncharacterized protein n=1 Tax=Gloeophyllum trabeum (strain ATCC 11539 / FP-39264 / Madison 617) TaxID=670483 RepID=S7PW22_GLOTA|nr:uncharacterized protein GLOTRDRAFT_122953 [Gloeophyllum trabeum ATCC 11539]EPQ51718.1 hypothetical protein GLOTRDRAFT_122953 [Gloeophyllum trabeum ATCC 11539]